MKTRFSTYDLVCSVTELQQFVGLRVNQVYDIDNKTYLIRLQKTDEKVVILLESGSRIHSTAYEWPKNIAPSGFSMKMRKHLRNKRLESLQQLGLDRIVDMQFGTGEAAYHVFLELYDRGNIVLTDCDLTILNILRPHTEADRIRFAVREKYPVDRARSHTGPPTLDTLKEIFAAAKEGDNLKKVLNPHLEYGPGILDHVLLGVGLQGSAKVGKGFTPETDLGKVVEALNEAEKLLADASSEVSRGYIIQRVEKRAEEGQDLLVNLEFHPYLFRQHEQSPRQEVDSFDRAVDRFFSDVESQKIDMKAVVQERDAMKKLENVRKDHSQRLQQLEKAQENDREKAELITKNQELVDQAIVSVRSALANQVAWPDIQTLVTEASKRGDPVASIIKSLRLDMNHITLQLSDPYGDCSDDDEATSKPLFVDIDLDLSAFANARKYYDHKRSAAKKQQKTLESQGKAFKSAEKKTKQTLKEMKAIVNISKARKVFWFEKFFWFITSENYLVIGGRDMAQNELIVKRYMRHGDIYVHADIHGASSVIIKNPTGALVPPKSLNEAGVMAICYSVAWEAKVVTTAWWVHSDQVSKTAPSGEYLTAGSFMVRGKKNYLPPANLIMGFSFLFKLEDGSIARHSEDRKVRTLEDEMSVTSMSDIQEQDEEVVLSEDDDKDDEDKPEADEKASESCSDKEDALQDIEEEPDSEDVDQEVPGSVFPDTEIKIHHTGKQISLETSSVSQTTAAEAEIEETIVFLGDQKPVKVRNTQQQNNKLKKKQQPQKAEEKSVKEEGSKEEGKLKRGQKGKLKKIKEKYKFQDEEDRQLRLEILQNVVSKKGKKAKEKEKEKESAALKKPKPEQKSKTPAVKTEKDSDDDEPEEVQEPLVNTDIEVITSLTGEPLVEDELLFAVPVVAPYNTLHNYKFKVKLTPGTGKRGKAARTALNIFLRDKTCSQREKELLKGVKDEDLARNLPGKVKVSAPQLHKK